MLPPGHGDNINGPSLIRVPDWVNHPLGRYYLYFAHHHGNYLRLAYADNLAGPWTICTPGVLGLDECICNEFPSTEFSNLKHLASPDVHVDHEKRELIMYFHCMVFTGGSSADRKNYMQVTLRASSPNGIVFNTGREFLGGAYFRVFQWDHTYYAIARLGVMYRSGDGVSKFDEGPNPFLKIQNPSMLRHCAVSLEDGILHVLYSRIGDRPESILLSKIVLTEDWNEWIPTPPLMILKPELSYEGANLPLRSSQSGAVRVPVRELRDPAIFKEDGKTYLLYTVAGESGIAIAEIGRGQRAESRGQRAESKEQTPYCIESFFIVSFPAPLFNASNTRTVISCFSSAMRI